MTEDELLKVPKLRYEKLSYIPVVGLVSLIIDIRDILNSRNKNSFIEIGTHAGESACMFLGSDLFDKAWLIDIWKYPAKKYGNLAAYELCKYNTDKFSNIKIELIKGKSNDIVKIWKEKVDVIYIDANHSYKNVKQDIQLWSRHIKNGGVICGHDYNPKTQPGVVKAVNELLGIPNKIYKEGSWLFKI